MTEVRIEVAVEMMREIRGKRMGKIEREDNISVDG
jgi:hypothetical protein